jgi:hypothetical protein
VFNRDSRQTSTTPDTCTTGSTPPVDYHDVVATLEREGVDKFVASVTEMLAGIATKHRSLRAA